MAYDAVAVVNRTLKRLGGIKGDVADITAFTDTGLLHEIDVVLQVWNETIHAVYDLGAITGETATGTITLATDTREYALPTSPVFEQMSGEFYSTRVMVNTDHKRLWEYPVRNASSPYHQMFVDQPDPANFTGQPTFWVINPTTNKFRTNTTPSSEQNGDVYSFIYDKRLQITATTDTFPFADGVVDRLLFHVVEASRLDLDREKRDPVADRKGFASAVKRATQSKTLKRYGQRRIGHGLHRTRHHRI